jgi:site-specific recombinase XerD
VERYHEKLRTFLNWLGTKSLRKVRKQDIESFLLWFKEQRQRESYTIRYVRETLSVFFSFVMRYSGIKSNPAAGLRIRTHFPQPERLEFFRREEVLMITRRPLEDREKLHKNDFPTDRSYRKAFYTMTMQYLMIKLMFSTGIRPSELVHMEVADLDVKQLRLRIRNKGNQQYIVTDRHVFLTEKTARELEKLLEMNTVVRKEISADRLFIHFCSGSPVATNYPNRILKYWAQRCGIARRVHAYMCRYTYCTLLVENGVGPYELKQLMGHRQMATTLKHYVKLTPQELRKEWKTCNPLQTGAAQ